MALITVAWKRASSLRMNVQGHRDGWGVYVQAWGSLENFQLLIVTGYITSGLQGIVAMLLTLC